MALRIGDNFSYQGQKPNFERDCFDTLAAMKAYPETSIDEGHLSYCKEDGKRYEFKSSNIVDPTTGKWREFKSGSGSDPSGDITQIQQDIEQIQQDIKQTQTDLETIQGTLDDSVWTIDNSTFSIGGANVTSGTDGFVGKNLSITIKYHTNDETEREFTITGVIPGGPATSLLYGLVKVASETIQSVEANSPTSEAGRTFPIQKNNSGQLVVNVPKDTSSTPQYDSMLVFDGVEAGAISIQDSTTPSFTDIIWSSTNKKFAAKSSDGQYYSNWSTNDRYKGDKSKYESCRLFSLVPKVSTGTVGFTSAIYARVNKKALGDSYTETLDKVGEVNITYNKASSSADGLMSKEDKAVIDSLPSTILTSIDPFQANANSVTFHYYSSDADSDSKVYPQDEEYNEEIPAATQTSAGVMTASDKKKLDSSIAGTIITASGYEELDTKDSQTVYFIKG